MSDLGLFWVATGGADIEVESDDLRPDDGLQTAALLSICLDARAEPGDKLPVEGGDRRGWWGDEFADVDGDEQGSRLWLRTERGVITTDLPGQLEADASAALQWMLDDGLAESVTPTATVDGDRVDLLVEIRQPSGQIEEFRWSSQWSAT